MVALAKKPASPETVPALFFAHRCDQSNWLTCTIGEQRVGLSRYRLYDAELGIFLSRDFLRFLNRYRCWSNNPVGQVDRSGLADTEQPEQRLTREELNRIIDRMNDAVHGLGADDPQEREESQSRILDMASEAGLDPRLTKSLEGQEAKATDLEVKVRLQSIIELIKWATGQATEHFKCVTLRELGDAIENLVVEQALPAMARLGRLPAPIAERVRAKTEWQRCVQALAQDLNNAISEKLAEYQGVIDEDKTQIDFDVRIEVASVTQDKEKESRIQIAFALKVKVTDYCIEGEDTPSVAERTAILSALNGELKKLLNARKFVRIIEVRKEGDPPRPLPPRRPQRAVDPFQ